MPAPDGEWPLLEIGSVARGIFDGPHATPKKTGSGPIFLGIWNLTSGRLDLSATEHLSEEDYPLWTRRVTPQRGDLVFSYETRLGQVAPIPEGLRCCLGRRMGLIRPDVQKVNPRFLLYAFLAPEFQETIRERTIQGSTVERIALSELPKFPIRIPPLSVQEAIVEVLGPLDDKIDLNRQMNRTLEAMAEAIFKSLFVDFDPVQAKTAGRQPFGVDAATADVFPSHFVDSHLGPIPEGWRVVSIDALARYVNGKNFTARATGAGRMVIRIAELNSGPGASTVYNQVDADPENVAYPGDMLFSWSGSLGVYRWHGDEALINQHIFKVIPNGFPQWYVYFQLLEALPEFQAIALDKATTLGHIKREHLSKALLPLPPVEVIRAADRHVESLYTMVHGAERENQTLASLRDILLPKLMSGEIRVDQGRKSAEEALA